jgi:hypothetical protein
VLAEVSCKKGLGVHVYKENKVVETFLIGDLFLAVFGGGKCIVASLAGGRSFVLIDSRLGLVEFL